MLVCWFHCSKAMPTDWMIKWFGGAVIKEDTKYIQKENVGFV